MNRAESEQIDLELERHYTAGILHPYEVYYYDIYLHGTGQRIGYIDLRCGHSDYLYYLGNIGYRIDEPWRGHHYAYAACRLVFPLARERGLRYLIITCDPDNEPSRKTLERLGGTYLGIKKVPVTSQLFLEGDRAKRIYRYEL